MCWPPGAASARAASRCARRGKRRLKSVSATKRADFEAALAGTIPATVGEALVALKKDAVTSKPKLATRQSSGKVLETIFGLLPELIGGSADLTPSNNTKVKNFPKSARGSFGGRYIHYGIREHSACARR
jgi:transketolase